MSNINFGEGNHLKIRIRSALLVCGLALLVAPAAFATPPANPGAPHNKSQQTTTTTTTMTPTPAGNAYGVHCKGFSKEQIDGQKGTPFSQCVHAMAQAATGTAQTAKAACKAVSKTHVDGQPGTPFSACVKAAAKLLNTQH